MVTSRSEESSAKLRFGYVSDYDKSRHMARVIFPELDNLVSAADNMRAFEQGLLEGRQRT